MLTRTKENCGDVCIFEFYAELDMSILERVIYGTIYTDNIIYQLPYCCLDIDCWVYLCRYNKRFIYSAINNLLKKGRIKEIIPPDKRGRDPRAFIINQEDPLLREILTDEDGVFELPLPYETDEEREEFEKRRRNKKQTD